MTDIDYPFHFNSKGQTANTGKEDHIHDMIEEFIFTSPGERVNRPDFGSDIIQMVFAPNSPELATALQYTIQAGLLQYLGDLIEIQALQVTSDDSVLNVFLSYTIRQTGEQRTDTFTRRNP
jgi:phage baseplate assembly protein W